jgi:hypothetical protein
MHSPPPLSTPTRKRWLWISVSLGIFLVIFSFLGPQNQVYVFFVFSIIILEGAIVIAFVLGETPVFLGDWIDNYATYYGNEDNIPQYGDANRPILSLTASVKNASEGSDYSRRIVARLILSVMFRKFGADPSQTQPKSFAGENLYRDAEFQRNLANIIYRYAPYRAPRKDLIREAEPLDHSIGKEEYLQGLKEILSKLGQA